MNKKSLYRHFALCSLPILIEFFLLGAPSNPSTFIPAIVLLRFIPVGGGSLWSWASQSQVAYNKASDKPFVESFSLRSRSLSSSSSSSSSFARPLPLIGAGVGAPSVLRFEFQGAGIPVPNRSFSFDVSWRGGGGLTREARTNEDC